MKHVPLSKIKDDLSRYLREAETQEIVITRHGRPAEFLIGFGSEDDWLTTASKVIRGLAAVSNRRGWKTSKINSRPRFVIAKLKLVASVARMEA
jgi:prevent-host-death family protein